MSNLPANLKNSQIQSSRHPNSLINFATNKQEIQIIEAIEGSIRIDKLEDWNELLKVVSKWRMYIGLPKKEVDVELTIATEYIAKTYYHLTLAEVELAYEMAFQKKLDDTEFFGYFSPLYISKVLESYLYYRKIQLADTIRKKQQAEHDENIKKSKPSPEQQCVDMKELIAEFYKKWEESGEVDDILNLCYKFLRRVKLLKVTQTDIDEALSVGKAEYQKNNKLSPFKRIDESEQFLTMMYARNHIVKKYFENVNIDVLLNNIKPEYFS